jgi:PAP2 superfamily
MMTKISTTFVLLAAIFLLSVCSSFAAPHHQVAAASVQPMNPVIQWNRNLLQIVRTPGAQPPTVHPTRSFAIMHAAIYDAVNAIDKTHQPYLVRLSGVPRSASQDAAAAAAAHQVLAALYPAFASALDVQLQQSLAQIPDSPDKVKGVNIGQNAAKAMLVLRSNDGWNAKPIPYVFGTAPGDYQSTPPNFPSQPQFTHWSHVTPFALQSASQFRPGPPPVLTSDTYSDAFNQVKSLGIAGTASTATADEALTGKFWNGAIQNYWNEISQTASIAHSLTTAQNARLFALLNLSLADDVIAFYDAKYTYNFWRPVTAIRAGDSDNNPETVGDPNWLPEVGKTAPDPSYPGAHAVISAAAANVLISFFERDRFDLTVTSEVLPGERSFPSFSAAAEEATLSRIFAGQHFRFDLTAGQRLGREIADFVVDNFLVPLDRKDQSDDR